MSPHPDALRFWAYNLDGLARCCCSCGWVSDAVGAWAALDAWDAHRCDEVQPS